MEPVTHILTGAVLARTGFNRKAAYATAAMAIAAELPDLDTVSSLFGPLTGFEHHRGITHTFVAVPFEAGLLTAAFWLLHRLRRQPATKAPPNWPWLFAGILLALLSHLLLDWTNNYGLRPFFPFNPRWYGGSFIFIFEPVLFAILLLALIGPALFGLINSEVGARKPAFRGRPSAFAALVAITCLYLFRYDQRNQAINHAQTVAPADTTRIFANPYPVNPFHWHVITDTPAAYFLTEIDNRTPPRNPPTDAVYKPAPTLPILAAKRSELGRVYLDWSLYPVLTEMPDNSDPNHPLSAVTFSDARFYYNISLLRGRPGNGAPPTLSGTVLLDMQAPEGQRAVEIKMGNRVQK